jgi:O-antigen/teichoic acid export membrane protein
VTRAAVVRQGGSAAQVASSQLALAASNYVVLAIAARNLDAAGLAAVTSYYLLINTVGRGLFAAVELETTRAVASARAAGLDDAPARRAALSHTGMLLVGAFVLLGLSSPLIGGIMGSGSSAIVLLAVGAVGMAASYLLRGPLAGARRYGLYAATFWLEAGVGLVAALTLVLLGDRDTTWWIAVLALAPLVAAAVLARPALRSTPAGTVAGPGTAVPETGSALRAVVWSAALLLAGQGVWNLAPVVVTSRLTDAPAVAAGFVTVAVILRAPVLFFPSVQALLLPMFAAMERTGDDAALRRTTRRLGTALLVAGVVWGAIAVFVVPTVSHLVFGATITPPTWVLAGLAASTVVGAAAQIGQTHLVAVRRPAAAAVAWIAGLAVLLVVALLAAPPLTAATVGQMIGALVVLIVLSVVRRRIRATP